MPNPTFRMSIIGRGGSVKRSAVGVAAYGAGKALRVKSVLAAASYRSGQPLRDYRQQTVYNYSERDDVRYEAILAPAHVPDWARDRETLWNAVELREKRADAQLARSFIIALPRELTIDQNIQLIREYVNEVFVSQGMVADLAVHSKLASDNAEQPHAHVLCTMREILENGEWAKTKNVEWNDYETPKQRARRIAEGRPNVMDNWRSAWEEMQNAHLEAAESDARVSMRSYFDQGLNRVPQFHYGVRVGELERQGEVTRAAERNRDTAQENQVRAMMDVMQPASFDTLREGRDNRLDMALLHADEISRMEEFTLEDDQERESELERE